MLNTGNASGEHLCQMRCAGGESWRSARGQQKRTGGNAIRHPQRAIHNLCQQADQKGTPKNTAVQSYGNQFNTGGLMMTKKQLTH